MTDRITLRFLPTPEGATVIWESITIGTLTSSFTLPYQRADVPIVIKALDAAQHPGHPHQGPQFRAEEQKSLQTLGLWQHGCVSSEAHRLVGQRLYAALTEDREGEIALSTARNTARVQGRPLIYVLRFPADAVELAALPWELLWDTRQAMLLSSGRREIDSLERYLDLEEALSPPLPVGKKLHILVLSPQVGIPRQVRDNERAAREKSWYALKSQGLLNWDELSPVTAQILDDRMRSGPTPDIIHYYGHGSYQDGQGYLVFDGAPESGQHELVSAQRLAALLGGIRLIVIHACQSAMVQHNQSQSGLLTGLAPALSAVSEAVVAMQLTVRISAATRFAEVFYAELARGRSLQKAVADARRSLYVIESDGASWYVPTLYIRTREQKPLYFVHTHTTIIERERRLDHPIPQPDHVPPHQEPNRDTQGILDTPVTGNQGGMIEEAESPDPSLFAELQELLMNKNWQAADEETGRIFLSIAKRQKKGWLRKNDIEQIPCTVIRAIDKLWADYSDRRFGFHTQKRIWQTVAEHRERFAIGDFIHFGDRVGWRAADKWLQTYDQFLFTVDAPEGHLPSLRMLVSSDDMHSWTIWKNTFEGLLSRIKQCL